MKRLFGSALWCVLAVGMSACATGRAEQDWGAVVIDLKPADTLPMGSSARTIERPWIGFGLAAKGSRPEPTPTTLHVRLRTGTVDEKDPKGQQLEMMEVRGIDIGRPRTDVNSAPQAGDGPVVIAVDPPSASITLTGNEIDWPYGNEAVVGGVARVSFHESFVEAAQEADREVTAQTLLRAALMGVTTADLRQYSQLELMPTIPQIIQLVRGRVAASEVQAYYLAGYGFGVEELLRLKAAGVTVEDAVGFAEGGFKLDASQLAALHEADVSPAYAIGLRAAGFVDGADGVATLIRLRKAGVAPGYAQRMRDLGVAPDVEALVRLHANGITPETVETFQAAKYNFDAGELIALKEAGVSAREALYFREAGYAFSMEDLIKLAKWRVPASFTLGLVSDDFALLSADQIIDLRLRRITTEQVRLLRQTRAGEGAGGDSPGAAAQMPLSFPEPPPLPPVVPLDPAEAASPSPAPGQASTGERRTQ